MLARFQSPWHARFLEVDPADDSDVMLPQSWNRYSYVRNSPLLGIDPDGRAVYLVHRDVLQGPVGRHAYVAVSPSAESATDLAARVGANSHLFTVGGAPDVGTRDDGLSDSMLTKSINGSSDQPLQGAPQVFIVRPKEGLTDGEFEKAVVSAADNYNNNAKYNNLASPGRYNCYSLARGLLEAAGADASSLPTAWDLDGWNPGWGKPLPPTYFAPPVQSPEPP
jgi:uncharacterized protein RhaS with RHS repeats